MIKISIKQPEMSLILFNASTSRKEFPISIVHGIGFTNKINSNIESIAKTIIHDPATFYERRYRTQEYSILKLPNYYDNRKYILEIDLSEDWLQKIFSQEVFCTMIDEVFFSTDCSLKKVERDRKNYLIFEFSVTEKQDICFDNSNKFELVDITKTIMRIGTHPTGFMGTGPSGTSLELVLKTKRLKQ